VKRLSILEWYDLLLDENGKSYPMEKGFELIAKSYLNMTAVTGFGRVGAKFSNILALPTEIGGGDDFGGAMLAWPPTRQDNAK
jgi:hypothetical protein